MKVELSDVQISRVRGALVVARALASEAMSKNIGDAEKFKQAQDLYDYMKSAHEFFRAAAEAVSEASFAPYMIVAVDDAGGPEGGKLMYYVQNEKGEAVSAKRFSYDEVAAQAQALANVRNKRGVAVDELVAA